MPHSVCACVCIYKRERERMDGVFTPIFVILMVCLLLECLSLVMYDFGLTMGFGMAVCARLVTLLLLYLAFVVKRRITTRALRHRSDKLLHFHSYVVFCVSLTTLFFHTIILLFTKSFRLYCASIILFSVCVAFDEYLEFDWLYAAEILYREQSEKNNGDSSDEGELSAPITIVELRPSVYYTAFKIVLSSFITYDLHGNMRVTSIV